MVKYWLLFLFYFTAVFTASSQSFPYRIELTPVAIDSLTGLQSFAWGQADGMWLLIGGRVDGLHRRQPWASFDVSGNNNRLIVVDAINNRTWSSGLSSLPIDVQDQLSSTNMEFIQEGDQLYCLGGYGYSRMADDHITFGRISVINVPEVIDAIVKNEAFDGYIRSYRDSMFQVAGGKLNKIGNTYYLLGGQKFIGRYNPMGPDHAWGFIQEYTNSIRKFLLTDDGNSLEVAHLGSVVDSVNLHRRDYNAESQIMPDGSEGITMYSGVFQYVTDLPFLDAVNVDSSGYKVMHGFQQKFNHYHCPTIPLYDASANYMHTLFFGGMAQFYVNNGLIIQDDNVPFVSTIARVTRDQEGLMEEYLLPIEMPGLLGAGAEFILSGSIPVYDNGVIKLNEIIEDTVALGYIFGGINSSAPNIFFINDGSQSEAVKYIFEVRLINESASSIPDNIPGSNALDPIIYPNPASGYVQVEFNLDKKEDVHIVVRTNDGRLLRKKTWPMLPSGNHKVTLRIDDLAWASQYLLTINAGREVASRVLITKE